MAKCPRCGHGIPNDLREGEYPGALCRRDNETMICSACGEAEAFEDYGIAPAYEGPRYWSPELRPF